MNNRPQQLVNGVPRSNFQQAVAEFMAQAGQSVPEEATRLTDKERVLRASLLLEETLETIEKGLGIRVDLNEGTEVRHHKVHFEIVEEPNYVEYIDGCCDVMFVASGNLVAIGIPDMPFVMEVVRANMERFGGDAHEDPETGKWIKPTDHKPPQIEEMLELIEAEVLLPQ